MNDDSRGLLGFQRCPLDITIRVAIVRCERLNRYEFLVYDLRPKRIAIECEASRILIESIGRQIRVDAMATIRERKSSRRSPRSRSRSFARCGDRYRPDHDSSVVMQTFDAIGQRLSLKDPTGITTYRYDHDSRLSTLTSPNGMRLTYA